MIITFLYRSAVWLLSGLLAACSTVPASTVYNRSLSFDTRIYVGDVPLDVVVFDTPEERERGLMYVEDMPEGKGALFVFPEEQMVNFWMKNMQFAMDILFFDGSGRLRHRVNNIRPCTSVSGCTSVKVGGVAYVLESKWGYLPDKIKGGYLKPPY